MYLRDTASQQYGGCEVDGSEDSGARSPQPRSTGCMVHILPVFSCHQLYTFYVEKYLCHYDSVKYMRTGHKVIMAVLFT